jgi:hypothetical protein
MCRNDLGVDFKFLNKIADIGYQHNFDVRMMPTPQQTCVGRIYFFKDLETVISMEYAFSWEQCSLTIYTYNDGKIENAKEWKNLAYTNSIEVKAMFQYITIETTKKA